NGHGTYKAKELKQVLDYSPPTLYKHLDHLIDSNLIEKRGRGKYRLTDSGHKKVEELEDPKAVVSPSVSDDSFKEFENLLPTEYHKAFFELSISAVYAKQNLFSQRESGWPGLLVLVGPSKTYKSMLGRNILQTIGGNSIEGLKNLPQSSKGEVGVRRVKEGKEYVPKTGPELEKMLYVYDEYDDAKSNIQQQIKPFLQGESYTMVEGEKLKVQFVPILTLNGDKVKDEFDNWHIRRGFFFNTNCIKGIRQDIDRTADKIQNFLDGPLCNPRHPRPGVEFEDDLKDNFRKFYVPLLKNEFWGSQADLLPAYTSLKGRMLSPLASGSHKKDILNHAFRLLQLAETREVEATVENWRDKFSKQAEDFTDSEKLEKAIKKEKKRKAKRKKERKREVEEEKEKQKKREEEANKEKVENAVEKYDFDLKKGKITSELEALRSALYPLKHKKANKDCKPARNMLDDLLQDLEKVHSPEELEIFAEAFSEIKERSKFKKAVKIAVLRRAMDSNNLKLKVANWNYFIDKEAIRKMKKEAKKVSGASKKQIPGDSQTKTTQSKDKTKKSVPSIPSELQHSRQEQQKSEKLPPSGPSEIPPPPKKQAFVVELLNYALPGRSDYKARRENYEQKKNDAELAAVKERGKEIRKNARIREKQREENRTGRPRHGTPADEL
ncbi:hypothetical protein AKJ54_01085, partial [candidate division MSBL1 archaeon SCGC-AAA382K21]